MIHIIYVLTLSLTNDLFIAYIKSETESSVFISLILILRHNLHTLFTFSNNGNEAKSYLSLNELLCDFQLSFLCDIESILQDNSHSPFW